MADEVDVMLQMWLSRWEQIRQSENQRAAMTNIVIIVVSAILGFVANKGLSPAMLPLSLAVLVLGIYGATLSAKYYERFRFHLSEAAAIRSWLDERLPSLDLETIRSTASAYQAQEFPRLIKIPLYRLWVALHALIALAGLALTGTILARL
ncbi:hypothetical protein ACWCHM_30770 [Micromonospora sp. SCSIO 07396]